MREHSDDIGWIGDSISSHGVLLKDGVYRTELAGTKLITPDNSTTCIYKITTINEVIDVLMKLIRATIKDT